MVMVGVDDRLGGAIELRAAVRPEVREIVQGLRRRGIKHIAIISGDHEAPTRKLAESLGMDRYFAQVLPADKAEYVEKLQAEGMQGLLRRRRHQRLDRAEEGERLDLARAGRRRSPPTRRTSSSSRRAWRSSASCGTSPASWIAT